MQIGLKLTAHDNVVSFPEELLVLEHRLWNSCSILPIHLIRPVLSEVDAIPDLLGSKRVVGEHKIVAALCKHGSVIVGFREHHDAVSLALSKEVVGCLIAQAHQNQCQEKLVAREQLTPVPTLPWLCGLLIVIIKIPSAMLSIIAFQYHIETIAPRKDAGWRFEIVWHCTEPEFAEGVEPFPEEVRVKLIDCVSRTLSL